MHLENLRLYNVRCHETLGFSFDSRFNSIVGLNGQGKTSILEAISLLAFYRSFRNAKNSDLILFGKEEGRIVGRVIHDSIGYDLEIRVWPKRKQAILNGKNCKLLSSYVGKLAAVSFSPNDLEIIRGSPENRRNWLDKISIIYDSEHIDALNRYQKILEQRNKQLKLFSERKIAKLSDDFDVWTEELIHFGAKVIHKRVHSVDNSVDKIQKFYSEISGKDIEVKMIYLSSISMPLKEVICRQFSENSLEMIVQALRKCLEESFVKEKILGTTIVGPHREDVAISFKEVSTQEKAKDYKSYASQGEVRSLILAMRLAEAEIYKSTRGIDPVILIDDFSSELDSSRRSYLLDHLARSQSQVFLTATEPVNLGKQFFINRSEVKNEYGFATDGCQ